MSRIFRHGSALGEDRIVASGLALRSFLELCDGAFATAGATAAASLRINDAPGTQRVPQVRWAHLVLSWSWLHALDRDAARHHLALTELGSREVDPLLADLVALQRVQLLAEEGGTSEALRMLAEIGARHRTAAPPVVRLTAIAVAQMAARSVDVTTLRDQVAVLRAAGCDADGAFFAAVADAAEGRTGEALDGIEGLLRRHPLSPALATAAAGLRVGLLLQQDRRERARELVPDLLTRAAPQRLLRALSAGLVAGGAFLDLLDEEAGREGGHRFAGEALVALRRDAAAVAPRGADGERPSLVGLLTAREREVLVELSYGGSYADVASALFVSENTVKTHLSSVYRKLGVERRAEALRVAREHRLA